MVSFLKKKILIELYVSLKTMIVNSEDADRTPRPLGMRRLPISDKEIDSVRSNRGLLYKSYVISKG